MGCRSERVSQKRTERRGVTDRSPTKVTGRKEEVRGSGTKGVVSQEQGKSERPAGCGWEGTAGPPPCVEHVGVRCRPGTGGALWH